MHGRNVAISPKRELGRKKQTASKRLQYACICTHVKLIQKGPEIFTIRSTPGRYDQYGVRGGNCSGFKAGKAIIGFVLTSMFKKMAFALDMCGYASEFWTETLCYVMMPSRPYAAAMDKIIALQRDMPGPGEYSPMLGYKSQVSSSMSLVHLSSQRQHTKRSSHLSVCFVRLHQLLTRRD